MATDAELLRSYARDRSEGAFTTLVQRHINLVYSAALREAHGDTSMAEDISQLVFAELAGKAAGLVRHPALAGWLYTCVRRMTANARRADDRRHRREQDAHIMNELLSSDPSESVWQQVKPVLDDAMHELSETDRSAVVLRFFEDRSLKEVGSALGLNENAARMRVDRALDKLQGLLAKRGVTGTASGLALAITVGAVVPAPAGLAASVASGVLTVAAAGASTTFTMLKLMTMTKLKAGVIAAVAVAGVATPLAVQHQTQVKLRGENHVLRQQVDQLAQLQTENGRLADLLAQANGSPLSKEQLSELMKLRGEVGLLRKQTNELGRLREENRRLQATLAKVAVSAAQSENDTEAERQKQEALAKQQFISKMGYARNWVLAFHEYAAAHQGQFPGNFDQAVAFLPDEARVENWLANNPFEIVYRGSLEAITNPATVIVLRENESQPTLDGGQVRTYGFADGHSEVHKTDDGNFEPWERQHMLAPPADN